MGTAVYTSSVMHVPFHCGRGARRGSAALGRRSTIADAVNIEQFLRERGFDTPAALARARALLEAQGLTHAGKHAFVRTKVATAEALLSSKLLRVCGDGCLRIDRAGAGLAREVVIVSPQACEICGGSNNRRAAIECVRLLLRRGVSRIVIVGGTENQQREMQDLLAATSLDVRYVDGTKTSHTQKDANANTSWAQLIVIWAPTPLKHAVSNLYTHDPQPHVRIVSASRRGIEALCGAIVRSYT